MPSITIELGKGSSVRLGRGATPTWTKLARLDQITMPVQPAAEIDVTNHDSPDRYEESAAGLLPSATVTLGGFYDEGSATDVLLLDLYGTGEAIQVEFQPRSGTARIWDGWVKNYYPVLELKGAQKCVIDIQVNAEITP